ncbi:ABC transporter permease [Arsenicicoccus sp. oral taxon 190]|uniref:ABC transporter permease n=1 Tax=Arsenicicoccus sp. oral taxon 190 TaxID=1658671 RepID=UPI000679FACA|nr:ABC transporter permease [Arsenicicoccus sp. oral taxon 190]AKT51109.1 ABC transporter [Arsenicicoccus sp. oral taxon 190]
MNLTYYRLELRRELRDHVGLFFIVALPAFMFVVFGATQSYGKADAGHGNVAAHIMISMAVYGAVTATCGIGATAAVEKMLGWGRQLGLTPLRDSGYVLVKVADAITIALLPVALIFTIGAFTGARAEAHVWWQSGLLAVLGALLFSLYGLVFGLGLRSRSAASAASGSVVILAFLGSMFMPLSGTMLQIGRLTPLYGIVQLARYPLTDGAVLTNDGLVTEPLWIPLANVVAWLVILGTLATWLVRRSRGRQ